MILPQPSLGHGANPAAFTDLAALARSVDAYSDPGRSHCEEVARLAARLAHAAGLATEHVARVRIAGLLHDIGKTFLPPSILFKPGPLTDDEYAEVACHPELGVGLIDDPALADVRNWVGCHHERPDGEGYPLGLDGDRVPLEARIIAIADAYEAMTSSRPYRSSQSHEYACEELHDGAGTQFDTRLTELFLRMVVGDQPLG